MLWLPLLQIQRDLLRLPTRSERFRQYLDVMRDAGGDLRFPLPAFNPVSRAHVAELLEQLLALDAEQLGQEAMHGACAELAPNAPPASTQLGLVIADDAAGGWTNRWLFEARHHFEDSYGQRQGKLAALLWSSSPAEPLILRETVRAAVFRNSWVAKHGAARTLEAMLRQEGYAARFAGVRAEALPPALSARMAAHLQATHYPTLIACLYGDEAATACGYDPLGLPAHAGLRFGASLRGSPHDALGSTEARPKG